MHAIMHDKFLVIDAAHVETGSFNFTSAAVSKNAENVIVLWNNPQLAALYTSDRQTHWAHSEPYLARY
jgi:phosphatidylserine/phosphatidylglycerophosphate/cardiolipin synthase-like enzyme